MKTIAFLLILAFVTAVQIGCVYAFSGPCASYEYRCDDGQCVVGSSSECDGKTDCTDGSDETGCAIGNLIIGLSVFFSVLIFVICPIIVCVVICCCVAGFLRRSSRSPDVTTTVNTTPVSPVNVNVNTTTTTTTVSSVKFVTAVREQGILHGMPLSPSLSAQQNQVNPDYPPAYPETGAAYPMQQYPPQQPGYPQPTDFSAYPPQHPAGYPPQEPPYPTA